MDGFLRGPPRQPRRRRARQLLAGRCWAPRGRLSCSSVRWPTQCSLSCARRANALLGERCLPPKHILKAIGTRHKQCWHVRSTHQPAQHIEAIFARHQEHRPHTSCLVVPTSAHYQPTIYHPRRQHSLRQPDEATTVFKSSS